MYIKKYWGNFIGGSDDSLNLVAFLEDQKKEEIPLSEIFAKIGLDKQNWDFRQTVEYLEFTHSDLSLIHISCVKVEVSQEKPVRYELGMVGNEDLDEELGEDEYFGFGVDAGMGCVADIQTQAAFKAYWAKRLEEDPDIDPYNDLFCDLLEENAKAYPKYQGDCGDWLNWTVPGTDCNLPIFASGWGDGYYPVYFGYDAKGKICAVYVRFIDIEASYKEQE